jgi:peptide/nickel transport system substrate-binding protein
MLQLNTLRKPFDVREIRKAVSLALDRRRMLREALHDYALPADDTGLADSQKRWKDPALAAAGAWTRHDPAAANRLFDAAGLARGAGGVRARADVGAMRYELQVVDGWSDWVAVAGVIRQNLADVGIDVTVKALSYEARYSALERGRFDLGLWFADRGPTPYEFYRGQMDPALVRPLGEPALANFHRFGSEDARRLLERFAATPEPAEQERTCRALQALFVEHAPSVPLFAAPLWGVFDSTRIAGYPNRFKPYGVAVPGSENSDALPVLVEVRPRE